MPERRLDEPRGNSVNTRRAALALDLEKSMSNHVGRFLWHDLNTTDVAAARDFYTTVVGWTLTPFNDDYQMFTGKAGPMGGAMPLNADALAMGAPPHWLGYVGVEDVDATVAKASALGGKVYAPGFDMPTVGRIAVLADPAGAVFGIFAPENPPENADAESQPGDISWNELMAPDQNTALSFYAELFGWEKTGSMDMGPMGQYTLFGAAGVERGDDGKGSVGGIMDTPPEMPTPAWVYYIHVEDLDAAVERTKSSGGTVVNGPMEIPGGSRVAQCVDPQGGFFALHG
jgi:predicted enzyme related to lactoylglutathione lyase